MARQATDLEVALALFERPTEPLFIPKGENSVLVNVPDNYIASDYQLVKNKLGTRFGSFAKVTATLQPVIVPNIDKLMTIKRDANFSPHIPMHRELAGQLISTFLGMPTLSDCFSAAAFCRARVNPTMFIYAYSVAMLHRPDARGIPIPPLSEIFPDRFIDRALFNTARAQAAVFEEDERVILEIPRHFTATDLELEHRVAYFREDLGINLHHWHWHLVYPLTVGEDAYMNIVRKDRRGEIFFYMHQQIVARYDLERMSNQLPRTTRLLNFYEPLKEGYFPKLDSLIASRSYAPRHSGATMNDVDRESDQLRFDIQDLVRWRDRVYDAIHKGLVELPDGTTRPLNIDMLGNMLEATSLSPNPLLYGDLHNRLHMALAFSHDPDNRHLESFGVIGDPATAMRDPLFFRLHALINDMFLEFKNTQPRYTAAELGYQGVNVTSVELVTPNAPTNIINTFWQQSHVDLSRGIDFAKRGAILARYTHLQHTAFQYRITVENEGNAARMGTVRIFLAPKLDDHGRTWQFINQKNLFIELDRFVVNLTPGRNTITRESTESTVTIPFEQTFRDLEQNRPTSDPALEQFNFCGCGWPQHMLVPKGYAGGFVCDLFVMVSNYSDDKVEGSSRPGSDCTDCREASVYCGVRDGLYPDRRSMGYPFDRLPPTGVTILSQFLTNNMHVAEVTIIFDGNNVRQQPSPLNTIPN